LPHLREGLVRRASWQLHTILHLEEKSTLLPGGVAGMRHTGYIGLKLYRGMVKLSRPWIAALKQFVILFGERVPM